MVVYLAFEHEAASISEIGLVIELTHAGLAGLRRLSSIIPDGHCDEYYTTVPVDNSKKT